MSDKPLLVQENDDRFRRADLSAVLEYLVASSGSSVLAAAHELDCKVYVRRHRTPGDSWEQFIEVSWIWSPPEETDY